MILKKITKEEIVSEEILLKYTNKLPKKLIDLWRNNGFGTLVNGFIKVVNPDDYKNVADESYSNPLKNDFTVMFVTGMGDLIIWEDEYIVLLNYRKGESKIIESGFSYFLDDLLDEELNNKNYQEAQEKLGDLAFDECYGYVLLLGMGGSEKVENLQKVNIKEYISITTQALGKIE
jgi:hypothetical protein